MALRSLEELNSEFLDKKPSQKVSPVLPAGKTSIPAKKKRRVLTIVVNSLFYAALIVTFMMVVVFSTEKWMQNSMLGYSFFSVQSGSMEYEIMQGSLIAVEKTDPQSLSVGDNITFSRSQGETVTHKIIEIHESYCSDGSRGFTTKGINNIRPDAEVVGAADVIGLVAFSIPYLGFALSFIASKPWFPFLLLGAVAMAAATVRTFFTDKNKEKRPCSGSMSSTNCGHRKREKELL